MTSPTNIAVPLFELLKSLEEEDVQPFVDDDEELIEQLVSIFSLFVELCVICDEATPPKSDEFNPNEVTGIGIPPVFDKEVMACVFSVFERRDGSEVDKGIVIGGVEVTAEFDVVGGGGGGKSKFVVELDSARDELGAGVVDDEDDDDEEDWGEGEGATGGVVAPENEGVLGCVIFDEPKPLLLIVF